MDSEYRDRENASGSLEDLISVASLVYSRISREDRPMRSITCEIVKIHWAKLSAMPGLKALISENPEFGIDMVAEGDKPKTWEVDQISKDNGSRGGYLVRGGPVHVLARSVHGRGT